MLRFVFVYDARFADALFVHPCRKGLTFDPNTLNATCMKIYFFGKILK